MAEGNETNSSSTLKTELDVTSFCSPCDFDGKKLQAEGYCMNCKEYLCKTCFKYHRLPTITRKHVLIDKGQFVSVEGERNRCPEHEKREIEYHCPTHACFGCHACFFQHQKSCRDSVYISEVAEDIPRSEEFKDFSAKLEYIASKTKELISNAKVNSEIVDKQHSDEIAAIKAFKLEVLETLDKLEKRLISNADSASQAESEKWKSILDQCTPIQAATVAIATEIEVLQNKMKNGDLYLAMVRSKDKLASLQEDLNTVESDTAGGNYKFEGNEQLLEELNGPNGLGKLVHSGTISRLKHVLDINVKTGEDSQGCCIRGSSLMAGGELVIVDNSNKKVKTVDVKENKIVSELKLHNSPWNVAKIAESTVAVTVPDDKNVVFVRTYPALSVDRVLDVKGNCTGIAFSEDNLVVSFSNSKMIQFMDLQGVVLREIKNDENGKALFTNPNNVTVDPENHMIYVCDHRSTNTVLHACSMLDGTIVATCTDTDLSSPKQTVVDSTGMVLVLGYHSKNIHLLTYDCEKVRVVLTKAEGLVKPETICYDEIRRRFFIGDRNNVKMYRVSYEVPEVDSDSSDSFGF